MWSGDKRDGKGTFFYTSKKQRMDGEWLEDVCKCGTLTAFEHKKDGEWEKGMPKRQEKKENEKLHCIFWPILA